MAAVTMSRSRGLLTQLTTRPVVPATAGVSGSNTRTAKIHADTGAAKAQRSLIRPSPTRLALRQRLAAQEPDLCTDLCTGRGETDRDGGDAEDPRQATSQPTPAEVNAVTGDCPRRERRASYGS